MHAPRGARWRAAGHEYGDDAGTATYGLWNDEWNHFTLSSVPDCTQAGTVTTATMAAVPTPAFNTGVANTWLFGISAFTGGAALPYLGTASTNLELAVSGQSGLFTPDIDLDYLDLYYIDEHGRARLLAEGGAGWSGWYQHDTGTGALGRT